MYSTAKTFDTSEMMLKNIGYLSCPQLKKKKMKMLKPKYMYKSESHNDDSVNKLLNDDL